MNVGPKCRTQASQSIPIASSSARIHGGDRLVAAAAAGAQHEPAERAECSRTTRADARSCGHRERGRTTLSSRGQRSDAHVEKGADAQPDEEGVDLARTGGSRAELIEKDSRRHGDVERFDGGADRERDETVDALARPRRESGAFVPDDERRAAAGAASASSGAPDASAPHSATGRACAEGIELVPGRVTAREGGSAHPSRYGRLWRSRGQRFPASRHAAAPSAAAVLRIVPTFPGSWTASENDEPRRTAARAMRRGRCRDLGDRKHALRRLRLGGAREFERRPPRRDVRVARAGARAARPRAGRRRAAVRRARHGSTSGSARAPRRRAPLPRRRARCARGPSGAGDRGLK